MADRKTRPDNTENPAVAPAAPVTLVSWVGEADLSGALNNPPTGPIVEYVRKLKPTKLALISDWPKARSEPYVKTLVDQTGVEVTVSHVRFPKTDPTDYEAVYRASDKMLEQVTRSQSVQKVAVHLSPGTPTMAAVMLLLAKTKYSGIRMYKGWFHKKSGKAYQSEVSVPFSLHVDFLPELIERHADLLDAGIHVDTSGFDRIIHRSAVMQRVLATAKRAALFPNPVLILGETGTGKELVARAIHEAGPRSGEDCVIKNCGAIAPDIIDSELFGSAKGGYTGAIDRAGVFEAANRGTIFLDEIGELPRSAQVRLLRVLQEGELQRIGEAKTRQIDVRVVAATNQDLPRLVGRGIFRSDLFYRLAGFVLQLPPLRDRTEDIVPLAQHLLDGLNEKAAAIPGVGRKHLSPTARKFAISYSWPGNVRELQNTLARAVAFTTGDTIRRKDLEENVLSVSSGTVPHGECVIHDNFNLPRELERIERQYIIAALAESGGVRERASKRLGYRSRQALSHRMRRLGVE